MQRTEHLWIGIRGRIGNSHEVALGGRQMILAYLNDVADDDDDAWEEGKQMVVKS